ncbi:hypothetical protein [Nostoc sp.]|uniref:hypothetical protein n=1 Tax=Nostoc sp. TaxID=1180 RepID=UPI002FF56C52
MSPLAMGAIALEQHAKLRQATNYSDRTNKGKDTDKMSTKFLSLSSIGLAEEARSINKTSMKAYNI